MRVLHLGTELSWRGGENQARLLIEGLKGKVEAQFAASPRKSVAYQEKRWSCELLPLTSGNPYNPMNIWQLVSFIKRNKIDLIDAHTAKAHTLALNALLFLPNTKLVVHRRVDNVPKSSKYFNPRISRFIAISYSIRDILIQFGVRPDLISVARSAISGEVYKKLNRQECNRKLKEQYSIPQDHILIGNASALSPQKGHETLLRALAILKEKNKKFSVLIAGDGNLEDELKKLAKDLNLNEVLQFIGFIRNVPEFLSGLDILAVPSNNEGLGTVILDGILAGCTVVGSRVGGIPEIIEHEQTGLLQEVGDHQTLSQNLLRLLESSELRQNLSQKAQLKVKTEFSLESMVEGNYRIYQEVLK